MRVQYELAMSKAVEYYRQKKTESRLDPNHTHFIVVDDFHITMNINNDFRLQCTCKRVVNLFNMIVYSSELRLRNP